MLTAQRIIHNDNGTLRDKSTELNNIFAGAAVVDLAATTDYLYIGSDLPFNHRYFQVSVVNAIASVVSVDIWDGSSWVAAVDVIDQTSVSGVPFAQSGLIQWTLSRNASWGQEADSSDVTGLSGTAIYDFYWARLKVSVSLTGTTALSYVGHKFASDAELGGYYPDLTQSAVMTAHTSGKTTWDDQHFLAAEEVVRDLRAAKIVWSDNQILAPEQFLLAGIHKVAHNIMVPMGTSFAEARKDAYAEYQRALNLKGFVVDKNEDGRKDEEEVRPCYMTVTRS